MIKILFRGKRLDNEEWVSGSLLVPESADIPAKICTGSDIEWKTYDVDLASVGQYTGVDDLDGCPIFEGDIVRHYYDQLRPCLYEVGRIFYSSEHAAFMRTVSGNDAQGMLEECRIDATCIYEVIGNIYENPELLKDVCS